MTAGRDYDVVILGGGLAGLSLAVRLAASPQIRTLVIEPRKAYPRDRTWSYWRLHDHPFGETVSHRWTQWEVLSRDTGGAPRNATQASEVHPYETIPADALYRACLRTIAAAPAIELRLGATAGAVAEGPDGVTVETPDGPVTASWVFDSRPPRRGADYAQIFVGQEVSVGRPVFDPSRVRLMDFTVPQQPGAVHFLYVLPFSTSEALVEDTWLAPPSASLPDHRAAIRSYLAERYGVADYAIGFEEEGAIPMDTGLQGAPEARRVIPIGTPGGAVKPSSGYGFLATQRMVDAIAADLAAGRDPRPVRTRDAVLQRLDAIFLEALRNRADEAPDLFHALFTGCPPSADPLLNDLGRRPTSPA